METVKWGLVDPAAINAALARARQRNKKWCVLYPARLVAGTPDCFPLFLEAPQGVPVLPSPFRSTSDARLFADDDGRWVELPIYILSERSDDDLQAFQR